LKKRQDVYLLTCLLMVFSVNQATNEGVKLSVTAVFLMTLDSFTNTVTRLPAGRPGNGIRLPVSI